MNGGMRIDAKQLPLRHQEQVAVAILSQITQTPPVAAKMEKTLKAKARRLCFPSARAIERYAMLKQAAREGAIEELIAETHDGRVMAFHYRVIWHGEFVPTAIPVSTLMAWWCQSGRLVTEPVKWRNTDAQ